MNRLYENILELEQITIPASITFLISINNTNTCFK